MTPPTPPTHIVEHAMRVASLSPCRSKRGVVLWDTSTGVFLGHGFNAPPALLRCPGREFCAGTCGQRAVHAEVRAIYHATITRRLPTLETGPTLCELLHVEVSPFQSRPTGGSSILHSEGIVACDGPSCGPCAALIADVAFVAGVWLFERDGRGGAGWHRYTAEEFYEATVMRCAAERAKLPFRGALLGHE